MSSATEFVFTPIKSRRTFEKVSNHIKELIFEGVFKPGDKLPPEKELAQKFQVGRQSVREALRILELSGFISIQKGAGGGAVIRDSISSTIGDLFLDAFQLEKITIEELTVARVEIEKIVLKYAIQNAEASDIRRLQENIRKTRKKIDEDQVVIDENIQFHRLLARASKNYLFTLVVEAITTALRQFLNRLNLESEQSQKEEWYSERVIRSRNTVEFHQHILDAIIAKDLEKAREWLERHLLEVKNRLENLGGLDPA